MLACALTIPAGALARAPAPGLRHAKGTVTLTGWSSLTIQTAGRRMGVINALTTAATAVTHQDYPYVWAGGHAEAGVASLGSRGPGYTGRRRGYDCSGAVAAVLSAASIWAAGSPVPNDAGVIRQLLQERLIARGPGTPPDEVTLYDDPGVHIFMNIDGRFFGTSDGGGGGNPKGGAGWLDDGAPDALSRTYRRFHILPSVLRDRASYGHSLTFQLAGAAGLTAGTQVGDRVRIGYSEDRFGTMTLRTVSYLGAVTAAGTVTAITPGGGSFAIQTASGATIAFSTGILPSLASDLEVGDQVAVTYTRRSGVATARAVTVTAPVPAPAPPAPTPTPTPTPDAGGTGAPGTFG